MVSLTTFALGAIAVAASGRATVEDVAAGRAYIDAGAADGLAVGRVVEVGSGRQSWLECTLDRVADHHASCPLPQARRGAPVRFPRPAAEDEPSAPSPSPPRAPSDPQRARAALAAAAFAEVQAHAAPGGGVARRISAEASLAAEVWSTTRDADPYERQRIDFHIRNLPLGFLGARAHVDATVFGWAVRPDEARFRPDGSVQLYVHEIAIESRDPQRGFTAAAGRIRPWGAPGVLYLDGIQFGVRPRGRGFEVGVLAGTVPDLLALEPTTERWTGGLYGRTQTRIARQVRLLTESRATILAVPDSDAIFEAESEAIVEAGRWLRGSAGARLAVDPDAPRLASARAAVRLHPVEPLEIDAVFRTRDDRMDPLAPSFAIVGADHGFGAVRYAVSRVLAVGAQGGVGHVRRADQTRGWAGPTLELPRVFRARGGLTLGYQEAFGDLEGRSGFVQALVWPIGTLRVLGRVSYLEDRVDADVGRQVATYLDAGWRAHRHFRVSAGGYATWSLVGSTADAAPFGLTGRFRLTARF